MLQQPNSGLPITTDPVTPLKFNVSSVPGGVDLTMVSSVTLDVYPPLTPNTVFTIPGTLVASSPWAGVITYLFSSLLTGTNGLGSYSLRANITPTAGPPVVQTEIDTILVIPEFPATCC
jgi:hypothetical protein